MLIFIVTQIIYNTLLAWRIFMNTTGIIAEYNPFHNGHLHQINTIRKETGADNIVVIMSGDFVQRGTPAFTDKYLRTAMALEGGADFVFELPVIYSSASAGLFALGGIALLDSLGFVNNVCFGSECNDIQALKQAADIILNGSSLFNSSINTFVKSGFSYPAAQCMAIEKHFPGISGNICKVLKQPNNILAIEYLKAIKLLKSKITPFTIKRCDNGYNNKDYENNKGSFASAASIRNALSGKNSHFDAVAQFIPESTYNILLKNTERVNINENMFSGLLYYKLQSIICTSNVKETVLNLTTFLDVSEALANRIIKNLCNFTTFTDFAKTLKTKQYTYSRICRVLSHILLDIHTDNYNTAFPLELQNNLCSLQVTPYARLLGINKNKSHILRNIKNTVLITKTADAIKNFEKSKLLACHKLSGFAKKTFNKDIFAASLYRNIQYQNIYYCKGNNICLNNNICHINNICPDEYRAGIVARNFS